MWWHGSSVRLALVVTCTSSDSRHTEHESIRDTDSKLDWSLLECHHYIIISESSKWH